MSSKSSATVARNSMKACTGKKMDPMGQGRVKFTGVQCSVLESLTWGAGDLLIMIFFLESP